MRRSPKYRWAVVALGLVLLTSSLSATNLVNRAEPDWWLTPRRMIQTNLRFRLPRDTKGTFDLANTRLKMAR